jgi:hypothetical protein
MLSIAGLTRLRTELVAFVVIAVYLRSADPLVRNSTPCSALTMGSISPKSAQKENIGAGCDGLL